MNKTIEIDISNNNSHHEHCSINNDNITIDFAFGKPQDSQINLDVINHIMTIPNLEELFKEKGNNMIVNLQPMGENQLRDWGSIMVKYKYTFKGSLADKLLTIEIEIEEL